ncbi:MAG: HAMP domain-containing protein [Nanobdellota archaeon]
MKILSKLLVVMLILTLIPLGVMGYLALTQADSLGESATVNAEEMGEEVIFKSTESMESLGEQIIMQKAEAVAKQLEIYIEENPSLTVEELQNDPEFNELAVQQVGETGYTAVHESESLINRFHAQDKTVNLDLHVLEEKLPGFYSILEKNLGGNEAEGYYDWEEPDGSIKQKYMYVAVADAQTADGVTFSVAATTYIDEFSQPVVEIASEINSKVSDTKTNIDEATNNIKATLLTSMLLTLLVVIVVTILFAHSLSTPIKKLKTAADKVTMGEFDVKLPEAKSKDEVSELTASMEMLITAFKAKMGSSKKNSGNKKK